jgi:hypothetical protein
VTKFEHVAEEYETLDVRELLEQRGEQARAPQDVRTRVRSEM